MKFGFDIDGCVFQLAEELFRITNKRYGYNIKVEDHKEYPFSADTPLSDEQALELIDEVITNYDNLKPIPGAIKFICNYYKITKNKPVFVTNRKDGNIPNTLKLLNKWFGIPFILENTEGTKVPAIKKHGIEYFIEDHIQRAIEIADAGTVVYMIPQPWNENFKIPHGDIIRWDWGTLNLLFFHHKLK